MGNRKYIMYYDVNSRNIYDENGTALGNNNLPYITTSEKIDIDLTFVTDIDPITVYTGFTGTNIYSSATIDNDWVHYLDGVLVGGYLGEVTEIILTYTGKDFINPVGVINLINNANENESINYTSFTVDAVDSTLYTFTVDATLLNTFAIGNKVKIQDVPLARANTIDETNKDSGNFIITISADSYRYYTSITGYSTIPKCVFEFLVRSDTTQLFFKSEFAIICQNIRDYTGAIPTPVNPSNYYTTDEVLALIAGKYDKLATGTANEIITLDENLEFQSSGIIIKNSRMQQQTPTGEWIEFWFEMDNGIPIFKYETI